MPKTKKKRLLPHCGWIFGLNGTSSNSLPTDKGIRTYLLPCRWVKSSTRALAKGIPDWKNFVFHRASPAQSTDLGLLRWGASRSLWCEHRAGFRPIPEPLRGLWQQCIKYVLPFFLWHRGVCGSSGCAAVFCVPVLMCAVGLQLVYDTPDDLHSFLECFLFSKSWVNLAWMSFLELHVPTCSVSLSALGKWSPQLHCITCWRV